MTDLEPGYIDEAKMKETLKLNRDKARQEIQDALDKITVKEIPELTDYDLSFLKARIMYLKPEEKEKFKSILIDQKKKIVK